MMTVLTCESQKDTSPAQVQSERAGSRRRRYDPRPGIAQPPAALETRPRKQKRPPLAPLRFRRGMLDPRVPIRLEVGLNQLGK